MKIREFLKDNILIADGAMGTYYDSLYGKEHILVEEANLTNPQAVLSIHKQYIESGARLIRTNTFASNSKMVEQMELGELEAAAYLKKNIRAGYELAKKAVEESGEDVFVAADIGPIPLGEETENILVEYKQIVDIFIDCGASIFVIETFPDVVLAKKIADYIKERREESFVMTQFALNPTGYTQTGISMRSIMREADASESIDAYGFNCGVGITHLYHFLRKEKFYSEKYITAMPNSGYPHTVRGKIVYSDSASYYGKKMQEILSLGVNLIGGCCGTTPSHIKQLSQKFSGRRPEEKRIEKKEEQTGRKNFILPDFMRKLEEGKKVIAVELDPPFGIDDTKLMEGCYQLKKSGVDIITVADSPLARSRVDSFLCGAKIRRETQMAVMPHIACRDRNRISMRSVILGGYLNEIRNLLIVTGDPVDRSERDITKKVFDFHSIQFMEYVKQMNYEIFLEEPIFYGGALNQNNGKIEFIIERMRKKIEAGASYFLTQPIYSKEDIQKIQKIKEALDTKILCGIMPLVSYRNAMFMKNEMPGILVPDEIIAQYSPQMTRTEATQKAIDICSGLIEDLYEMADGFYFMTPFHRVDIIKELVEYVKKIEGEGRR